MKPIHKQRLLKLAKHLRGKNLSVEEFNFWEIHHRTKCGTLGCAIGELPALFPKHFRMKLRIATSFPGDKFGDVVLRAKPSHWDFQAAESFFGLDGDECAHLFSPYAQDTNLYGGNELCGRATAKQVAANIEAFVKRKEKEGK